MGFGLGGAIRQGSGEGLRSNKLSKIRVDLGGVKWVEMGK